MNKLKRITNPGAKWEQRRVKAFNAGHKVGFESAMKVNAAMASRHEAEVEKLKTELERLRATLARTWGPQG